MAYSTAPGDFDNAISGSGSFMYGLNTAVAVDSEGAVHILYSQSSDWLTPGDLKHAVKRNNSWTFSTVIGNGIRGRFSSLAIDSQDNLHATWLDIDAGNASRATVQYGTLDKGSDTWEISQVDTLNNVTLGFSDARKSTSIAIDSADRPHIAFGDDRILKYGAYENGQWELTTVAESDVDLYKGWPSCDSTPTTRRVSLFGIRCRIRSGSFASPSRQRFPPLTVRLTLR